MNEEPPDHLTWADLVKMRDRIAEKAMEITMMRPDSTLCGQKSFKEWANLLASQSYQVADAMLAARRKKDE